MSSSSELYTTMQNTVRTFFEQQAPEPPGTNNTSSNLSSRTEDCQISFGPSFFVSTRPELQGSKTNDEFLAHMKKMTPMLETWRIDVERMLIDEYRKEASAEVLYSMIPKGEGSAESRTVPHGIHWWLKMTDDGKLVERATENVDAAAAARIFELVSKNVKSQGNA